MLRMMEPDKKQRPIRVVPIASCSVTIPLIRLRKRNVAVSVLPRMGFTQWPLSFSPGSALQLALIARGDLSIPYPIDDVCYGGAPNAAHPDAARVLSTADIVMLEMSTPIEFVYRGLFLNQNRLRVFLRKEFGHLGADTAKAVSRWIAVAQKLDHVERESAADRLVTDLKSSGYSNQTVLDLIAEMQTRRAGADEISERMRLVRALMGLPVAVVLYNFRYMPDGRAIDWPTGFRADVKKAAINVGLPLYDPASLVQRHTVPTAMIPDSGHYRSEFNEIVADDYLKFMCGVIGRQI